jgi:hypothetical protein
VRGGRLRGRASPCAGRGAGAARGRRARALVCGCRRRPRAYRGVALPTHMMHGCRGWLPFLWGRGAMGLASARARPQQAGQSHPPCSRATSVRAGPGGAQAASRGATWHQQACPAGRPRLAAAAPVRPARA